MKRKWINVPGVVVGEIEIAFLSTGEHDPAHTHPNDPEVGGDERVLDEVVITVGSHKWDLPKDLAEAIFDHFMDQIIEEELSHE